MNATPRRCNVWVVAVGEPLPIDGPDERLHRAGQLSHCLAARGHPVTWWTSAFDHRRKAFRSQPESCEHEGIEYRLLRGCGYARNISLRRIRDQRQVAAEFVRRSAEETELPDVLFAAYPTVELASAAVDFGDATGRPTVVDVRDLWPDIFVGAVPSLLEPVARIAVNGMKRKSARVLAGATGITGITQSFVDWGAERAGRLPRDSDRAFPLACERVNLSAVELEGAKSSLAARGAVPRGGEVRVVFAGALSRQFNFQPVFDAAAALRDSPVTFVIAGAGEMETGLRERAAELPNVAMVGWLDRSELSALMASASVGLAPYHSTWDFESSIPNKVIEYLAWGLPVVSSLRGEVAALLDQERVGTTFGEHDSAMLIGQLRDLAANRPRMAAMSERASALFTARFSAARVYPAMADYLELIAAHGCAAGATPAR